MEDVKRAFSVSFYIFGSFGLVILNDAGCAAFRISAVPRAEKGRRQSAEILLRKRCGAG